MDYPDIRRIIVAVCALGVLCLASAATAGDTPVRPEELTFDPLAFKQSLPEGEKLESGVTIYLRPDHDVPTVTIYGIFRAGSIYDPPGKIGVAEATATLMRQGGTASWDEATLDRFLDARAINLNVGADREEITFSVDTLTDTLDDALAAMTEVLTKPAFADRPFQRYRREQIEEMRRRNDNPQGIAEREFAYLIYGKYSPWARTPTPEHIISMAREDLVAHHATYIRPNNLLIGVCGDFDPDDMRARLAKAFAGWAPKDIDFPEVEPIAEPTPGVYYVNQPIPNTEIRIGHLGIRRHAPEMVPLDAINQLYGIGFNSRLMREVRSNRGLAYSVYGVVTRGTDRGMFMNGAGTKSSTTGEAVSVMVDEIRTLDTTSIGAEELTKAVEMKVNSYVFEFASPFDLIQRAVDFAAKGYPVSFHAEYLDRLQNLTAEEATEIAQRVIHPDKLVILLVGSVEEFREQVKQIGYPTMTEVVLDDYSNAALPEEAAPKGDAQTVVSVNVPAAGK